jgi:hypothetical protein
MRFGSFQNDLAILTHKSLYVATCHFQKPHKKHNFRGLVVRHAAAALKQTNRPTGMHGEINFKISINLNSLFPLVFSRFLKKKKK